MKKEKKDLPGWVNGGLIAVIIYILIFVSNIVPLLKLLYSIQIFCGDLLFKVNSSQLDNFSITPLFSFVIAPLIWFIGGSLIDKIIERRKSN